MDFRRDDRGQAIQVGAVLLFAMLIIAMSIYQAQVVPRENAKIEFDSYLDASSDMTKLRNDMLGVAATNNQRGTTVTTGTTYPARVFFVNPATATGRIRTGDPENLTFSNVRSTSDNENVDQYFQSEDSSLEYTTRDVRFVPFYNEIDVAPVVVANGFTYRNYSTPIPLTTQTMIQGNRLTFVTVAGDFEAGGLTTPITTDPISAHTRTVTVTNRTSDPLVITVPTPISASTWESDIIAGQMDPAGAPDNPNRYVTDVATGPRANTVNITLEPGANYELSLGRIELHEKSDASEATSPEPRYLVAETDRSVTTKQGRVKLTVEARDRFNNPVSNAIVNFSGSGYDFETQDRTDLSMPIRTDENGQATVWYNATGIVGNLPVTANLSAAPPAADEKKVAFTVTNTFTGTGGGGGDDSNINPGNYVVLEDAQKIDATGGGNAPDRYRINTTFENQGTTAANITAMRFTFYFEEDNNLYVVSSTVYRSNGTQLMTLPIRGAFDEVPGTLTIPPNNGAVSLQFAFDSQNGDFDPSAQTDFFVVEFVYNDATTATYFVNFQKPP